MGLAAAYQAVLDGHDVLVLEAGPVPGGMAAHFDFGGISIERFYHFVCRTDQPTFELLSELGLSDKLHWVPTTMGFYANGRLNKWGDPISLVRLPDVGLFTKLRYGVFAFVSMRRNTWPALETISAKKWILRWCGRKGYELFWRPLLEYKFYEFADSISAAWIWTRIKRVGRSRKSVMQEELGFIEGGSQTLVNALVCAIQSRGGRIELNSAVERVTVIGHSATGVQTAIGHISADHVISTIPIPTIERLVPDLPESWKDRYRSIKNIGICCVIFKLTRSISPHFWINIADDAHEIPGAIEFSNLRKVGPTIVYVPYYMPATNPKFSWTDEQLIDDAFGCLVRLKKDLQRPDVIDAKVSRLQHAQPICEIGFAAKLPPVQTPFRGLQIADTCFYYPEDRGISESVRLAREMARSIGLSMQENARP
jgi:protoporphyrinogen oxidase